MGETRQFQAAIFDLDGTLLDSMGRWSNLCREFLLQHGIDEDIDLDGKLGVLSIRNALVYTLEYFDLDLDLDEACAETWQIVENFYREKVELKPGITAILAALKERNIPAGVLTATESGLVHAALERVGLREYFGDRIISCADRQMSKRSPEVFFLMTEKLNASPEKTIVFEDALYASKAAKNAGFTVAAVFDPCEKDQETLQQIADRYFASWEDFPLEIL